MRNLYSNKIYNQWQGQKYILAKISCYCVGGITKYISRHHIIQLARKPNDISLLNKHQLLVRKCHTVPRQLDFMTAENIILYSRQHNSKKIWQGNSFALVIDYRFYWNSDSSLMCMF